MKAAALKGKTIRKVHQKTENWNSGRFATVTAIEFTDGSFLRFVVAEGEGDYGVVPIYPAREVEEPANG
jgi:hypothetical protein